VKKKTTEEIHEEMNQVTVSGRGLKTVAAAVDALNLSLSHHAAWTDERFDRVDLRFDAVDKRFDQIDERFAKVDQRFDAIEERLDGLEGSQGKLLFRVEKLEAKVDNGFAKLDAKIDGVREELGGKIDQMTARIEQVLSFAVRDELGVDEIDE
jgi:chromosome segregation ATPase